MAARAQRRRRASARTVRGPDATATTTTVTPATNLSAQRGALLASFLGDKNADIVQFAAGMRKLQDSPEQRTTTSRQIPGRRVRVPGARAGSSADGLSRYPLARAGKIIGTPHAGTHTLGNWQSDNAVDLGVPEGTPMRALEPGTVERVRHHPQDGGRFAGDQITVRGASGREYFYAHGKARVKPGQKLAAGAVLGRTGSANGVAHLHFGQSTGNPQRWLGRHPLHRKA
jgi:murein DD-endopeptidase MepM/ murein hydrolase activator NlpD